MEPRFKRITKLSNEAAKMTYVTADSKWRKRFGPLFAEPWVGNGRLDRTHQEGNSAATGGEAGNAIGGTIAASRFNPDFTRDRY